VSLVLIVKNWDTLTSLLFPVGHAAEARIATGAESDIGLQEYELQDQSPGPRPASASVAAPGDYAGKGSTYRLAIDGAPAGAQRSTGTLVAVSFEEEAKNQEEKIKAGGEKVKEEAKHDEENAAHEEDRATAEQKSAEIREQAEQEKEHEDQQRAEETQSRGAAEAKTEEEKARRETRRASETVQAKKEEAHRPPSQRRIELGAPVKEVEEVLAQAGLPEHCRPSCTLKAIVEKALTATSGNPTEAAREVRGTVAPGRSGARVHFALTLYGLEHKVVVLTYSLVRVTGAALPAPYLQTVKVTTVAPAREGEVIVGKFWVPVPSDSGKYYVELTVDDGKTEVAYKDTNPFR
jgi:hypothetical protein